MAAILAGPLLVVQVGRADLDVYRRGASAFLHGASLYAPLFAARVPGHLPFTYPPFAAAAAVVLLIFPSAVVPWMWAITTVMLLGWCLRLSFGPLLRSLPTPVDLTLAVLTALVLYTRPVFDHLSDGQVDILLMALCLADAVTPRPRWPRGALVGIATAIKLVPGIFIPYLWLTGRRRAAIVATATFLTCDGAAALVAGGDSRRYWTRLMFDTERPGYTAGYKNQSLRGVGLRLLPSHFPLPSGLGVFPRVLHLRGGLRLSLLPGQGRTLVLGLMAVLVVTVGLAMARSAAVRGRAVTGAITTGLVGVLASPVSWIHATVWAVPAIGVLVGDLTSRVRVVAGAALMVALLAGLPYVPNVEPGLATPVVVLLQASFGLVCLLLVAIIPGVPHEGRQVSVAGSGRTLTTS